MLGTLDTVIAYAVIMAVVSLLITLVVQMLSAAFSLRGKNLANALSLTFQTIDPRIGEEAHALAEHILTDPILSDSLWVGKTRQLTASGLLNRDRWDAARKAFRDAKIALDAAKKPVLSSGRSRLDPVHGVEPGRAPEQLAAAEPAGTPVPDDVADTGEKAPQRVPVGAALPVLNSVDAAKSGVAATRRHLHAAATQWGAAWWQRPFTGIVPPRDKPWRAHWHLLAAFKLATAVRPGEVYRFLHDLSDSNSPGRVSRPVPGSIRDCARQLLVALGTADQPAQEARDKLAAVRHLADAFDSDAQGKAVLDSFAQLGTTVERATTGSYDRFQRWFGSAQDRAEQWFQTHVRVITVLASFVVALLLQLDTIEIFRDLRRSPALTQALVAAAPNVLASGQPVLDPATTPADVDTLAQSAYRAWRLLHPLDALANEPARRTVANYVDALAARLSEAADSGYLLREFDEAVAAAEAAAPPPRETGAPPAASPALVAYGVWAKKFPAYALLEEPSPREDKEKLRADLRAWLKPREENEDKTRNAAALIAEYRLAVVKTHQDAVQTLSRALDKTGFDVVPTPLMTRYHPGPHHHRGAASRWKWLAFVWGQLGRHLPGTLITAGLLTLGAPFWFNLLKNLMSLRPAVASIIERRPQSSPALPQNPPSPAPTS